MAARNNQSRYNASRPAGLHRMAYKEWGDPRQSARAGVRAWRDPGGRRFRCPGARAVRPLPRGLPRRGRPRPLGPAAQSDVLRHPPVRQRHGDPAGARDWPMRRKAKQGRLVRHLDGRPDRHGPGVASRTAPIGKLVLNDIGPTLDPLAMQRIADYIGQDLRFDSFEQGAQFVRDVSLSFGAHTEAQWHKLAADVLRQDEDGKWVRHYDMGLAAAVPSGHAGIGQGRRGDAVGGLRCDPLPDPAGARRRVGSAVARDGRADDAARTAGRSWSRSRASAMRRLSSCRPRSRSPGEFLAGLTAFLMQNNRNTTMEITRLHVGKRLSEVAIHNGTVYLAGQIAEDTSRRHRRPDPRSAGPRRPPADRSGQRQDLHPDVPDLHQPTWPISRHECRVGRLGRRRPHAAARHRRGQAGRSRLPGRDRASPPRCAKERSAMVSIAALRRSVTAELVQGLAPRTARACWRRSNSPADAYAGKRLRRGPGRARVFRSAWPARWRSCAAMRRPASPA